jgi:ArsR family transcriptional regulator
MNASKAIELMREPPVRGADCCAETKPSRLSVIQAKEQAKLFAALGDPTRLGILALLAAQDAPLCVCEIVDAFPLGQPTISHHLKLLREAGLVWWEKRGLWVYYAPNAERMDEIGVMLSALKPRVAASAK